MSWAPQPGRQTEALKTRAFELLYGGARFGGKSEVGRAWLLKPFKDAPEESQGQYTALVIRKNLKDLKEWMRKAAMMYTMKGLDARIIGGSSPEVRWPNGAVFYTGHLANEDSWMQYIGWELHRILIEELNQIPQELQYLMLLGSCRSTVDGIDARLMANTNPGGPGHAWIKSRWNIEGKPPYQTVRTVDSDSGLLRVFIPATIDDNPIGRKADPRYEPFLNSLPTDLRLAWREGDWTAFVGQFFDLRDEHLIEPFEIPDVWPLWCGMDYGTTNPTAVGLYTRSSHDDRTIRIAEYYKAGMSAPEYAREIKYWLTEELKPWTGGRLPAITYADPSMWVKVKANEWLPDMSPADSFDFMNMVPANNDRVNGWRNMKSMLAVVDKECKFGYFDGMNPEFEKYMPSQIPNKTNPEDLQKCNIDHIADECRYALIGQGAGDGYKMLDEIAESRAHTVTTMQEVF